MKGRHPAVVVQNEKGNLHSPTLIVCYLTSQLKRLEMKTHVLLQHYENLKLELTVTNDVLSDMQSAIRFVEEYLYNVDPATAGAIINYKLKEKFVSFKTPDLKALVSKQKQPYVQNRDMDDGGTLLNESNVPQCLVMYFAMLKAYSMYLF